MSCCEKTSIGLVDENGALPPASMSRVFGGGDKITTLRSIITNDVVGETVLCPADVMKSAFCNF